MESKTHLNNFVNSITKIPSQSIKLAFFALPPFHLLYMYAIAVLMRENKSNANKFLLFYVLGLVVVSFILSAFFLINLPGVFQSKWLSGQLLVFIYGLIGLYLMFLIHLTVVTVEFDRQKQSAKYFDFTDIDYFTRFITLLFLPITIWWFQNRLHRICSNETKFWII